MHGIKEIRNEGVLIYKDKILSGRGDIFICSFSTNGDSSYLWNNYTKNEKKQGYNLSFCPRDLKFFEIATVEFLKTIYDKKKQIEIIYNLIDKLKKYYKENKEGAEYLFCDELRKLKYVFKKACYKKEEEARGVVFVPDNCSFIKYRTGANGIFIPYVELPLKYRVMNFELSFDEFTQVVVSPYCSFNLAQTSLKAFLEKNNFKVHKIKKSNCRVKKGANK